MAEGRGSDPAPDRRPSLTAYTGGRSIGRHRGNRNGPLLVCVAGMHGNEPAGVEALRRVLGELGEEGAPPVSGVFVALVGNVGALQDAVRYRDRDLNRQWTDPRTSEVRGSDDAGAPLGPEGREQRNLLRLLERALEEDRHGPAYLVDLHTTSGESPPFAIAGRREACRRFADTFPIPRVRGLERYLPGMLSDWACRRGFASVTAEAGQHVHPSSVARHRAIVWSGLAGAGLVDDGAEPVRRARQLLIDASDGVPRRLHVCYRHAISPANGFRMKPGRKNFDPVEAGEVLAGDREGAVTAPETGRIFLPLYQELGSDGFFLVREDRPD